MWQAALSLPGSACQRKKLHIQAWAKLLSHQCLQSPLFCGWDSLGHLASSALAVSLTAGEQDDEAGSVLQIRKALFQDMQQGRFLFERTLPCQCLSVTQNSMENPDGSQTDRGALAQAQVHPWVAFQDAHLEAS